MADTSKSEDDVTTAAENERLGVLETKVSSIERDVSEIKTDVKALVASNQAVALQLATRDAAELAASQSRNQTGVWFRFASERAIALLALAASILAILNR